MININTNSAFFILALSKFLLGVMIFHLKNQIPNIKGINYWSFGSILTATGFSLFAFFPRSVSIGDDFLFSLIGNLFVFLGDAMFITGFIVFKGKPVNRMILFGIPALVIANILLFTIIFPVIWIRFGINNFIAAILYFLSFYELRKEPKISLTLVFKLSSYVYLFFGILQVIRTILVILIKPSYPMEDNLVTVVLIGLAGICINLLTFNLIILISATLNDQLREQVASKNKLYAIISHDLRGLAGNLINYNRTLKEKVHSWTPERTQEWIIEMEKTACSAGFLLENIFNWSKSQLKEIQISLSRNDMNLVVVKTIRILQGQANIKNIKINYTSEGPVFANFDFNMIEFVVRNLLSNAIKFSHRNGLIIISVVDEKYRLKVCISDNGVGIDETNLALLFDDKSFYNTRGTEYERGSGFGLKICKEFVELHKGEITVESTPNIGSSFCFVIYK